MTDENFEYSPGPSRPQTLKELSEKTQAAADGITVDPVNDAKLYTDLGYSAEGVDAPDPSTLPQSFSAPGYTRFAFLSGGVFYINQPPLMIRRFKGVDISAMALAAQKDSVTALLDVLANTSMGMDVRDLTSGDFKYLLYWQRLHSFPKRPWVRKWTSRYGNENIETVEEMGKVYLRSHKMTTEEYMVYYNAGLRVPTMRDIEYLEKHEGTRTAADSYTNQIALFFQGNSMEEKIKTFEEADGELIAMARELEEKFDHGVTEILSLVDKKFKPKEHIERLRNAADNLELLIPDYIKVGLEEESLEIRTNIERMRYEANKVEADLEKGKEVLPEAEEISVPMSAASFLSGI